MNQLWTIRIALQDEDDIREIEFTYRLTDTGLSRHQLDLLIQEIAKTGVDKVLRAHRKIMVGEE